MRPPWFLVLLVAAAVTAGAPKSTPPAAGPETSDVIQMHVGVPGLVYLGQPLAEFIARFPTAQSSPVPGQPEIVKVQVSDQGISCLAAGRTPATMTIESIGFNFGPSYEGLMAGRRRTVEGIGSGSNVNDVLGSYGPPAGTSVENPQGLPSRSRSRTDDPNAPVRHNYRSADGSVTTYFVVQGHEVLRMAIARPAEMEKHLSRRPPAGAPQGGP